MFFRVASLAGGFTYGNKRREDFLERQVGRY